MHIKNENGVFEKVRFCRKWIFGKKWGKREKMKFIFFQKWILKIVKNEKNKKVNSQTFSDLLSTKILYAY